MSHRRQRPTGAEFALLVLLAAWALFPLVIFLIRAAQLHGVYTGADGLIGADGVLGADQLQYLAWARDAAHHGLASDLFTLEPNGHVYLQPVFLLVGLLSRVGLSLPLAYQLIKPLAVIALFAAAVAWCGRFLTGRAQRAAGVALALFMALPVAALYSWTQDGASSFRFPLYLLSDEVLAAGKLWGYLPSALGLALVPAALLAVARAIDPRGAGSAAQRARTGSEAPGPWLVAGLASLGASWLHPWQGVTLIVLYVALAAWRRGDGVAVLIVGTVGAGLPLVYYWLLGHTDPAWTLAAQYEVIPRLPALALLAGLGPAVVLAAVGLASPGDDPGEQALLLWAPAALVTYFANDAFAAHALQGLSFPLAVLMVRGGTRVRLPVIAGAVVVLVFTVPGLAYDARKMVRTATGSHVQYVLTSDDARALAWVDAHQPPGGILAPTPFASVVPYRTGLPVYIGHGYWSRDYVARARVVDRLFDGRMRPDAARALVAGTGAGTLIADCAHPRPLNRLLGPLIAFTQRFGCARVYLLAGRALTTPRARRRAR